MPSGRIKKDVANEREQFMLSVFKKEPSLSVLKANKQLQEKFGTMMRAQRAYQLRDIARKEIKQANTTAPAQAGRKANKPTEAARSMNTVQTTGGHIVIVEGSSDKIQFLKSALEVMHTAGFKVPRIDHQSDSYAVVKAE